MDPNLIEINEITGFWSFLISIDWRDPWLIGLIFLHITVTITIIVTRNYGNFQIFLFLILLVLAYFSETINEYAAHNWHLFSKQQYFDSNGLFISTVFSIPILLNCMLLIGGWIYSSTQLMYKLKTAQLKAKLKRVNQRENSTECSIKSD